MNPRTKDTFDAMQAIIESAIEARDKERQRCLDIVKGLRSDSPTWSRDDEALIDGCSGPDLIDVIVDEIAARIAGSEQ